MVLQYAEPATDGLFYLIKEETDFHRHFFRDRKLSLLTIAWNRGADQKINIDGVDYQFASNSIVSLMTNNTFSFERPEDIVAWQYNRAFYCIIDHDKEVSCVGFLFYGSNGVMFMELDADYARKINALLTVFLDEFSEKDNIQGEMLRMLLKRLIILITRLAKRQHLNGFDLPEEEFDIVRRFNLLVENHYRQYHQVQDYANLLNKSPKTLSNLFAQYNHKTPLQVIKERIALEAKRLLQYTDKTSKEIAFELGFEDPANFSRFFKQQTGLPPGDFKASLTRSFTGKN
jgi:AraC family transcriptional regulator, transcriptional activator of pobA